jgi:phospholipid-binding lipoprotein MlaA
MNWISGLVFAVFLGMAGLVMAQEDDLLGELEAEFAEPTEDGADADAPVVKDPLKPFNRAMFTVNDKLYFWVLKPAGKGWRTVVPKPARSGLGNFFNNLRAPGRTVNALLQGKFKKAGTELERFTVNTTFGFLGFDDAATEAGTPAPSPEDTGQTFAVWRIGPGWYVVWPIFGPSSIRDTVGMIGDRAMDPLSYAGEAGFPVGVAERVNAVSLRIGEYEELKRDALDPYAYLRDVWWQNRERRIEE